MYLKGSIVIAYDSYCNLKTTFKLTWSIYSIGKNIETVVFFDISNACKTESFPQLSINRMQ